MSWRRNLRRIRALPPARRRLAGEAALWLGVLRLAVVTLPFRWVAAVLHLTPSPASDTALVPHGAEGPGPGKEQDLARAVGWAVCAVGARTPWSSTCLVRSLAGYVMLRRRHLPSTVILGVAKGKAGELAAHSWLLFHDQLVTGGAGHERFRTIAAYRATAEIGA